MQIKYLFTILVNIVILNMPKSQIIISGGSAAAGNYTTLSQAINSLNMNSVTAPVFIDISANHIETISNKITLTATGSVTSPIVIQKSGSGLNPKLIAYTGTVSVPSVIADGFFVLAGSDYITIDGLDLEENISNTTTTTVMEFGYALFKASTSDGCQHNTIKNCKITLNKIQNTAWTAPGHNGSIGITINNGLYNATGSIVPTAASGSNSFNSFYNNTIQNCNAGIAFIGYLATSGTGPNPNTSTFLGDLHNDVGGTSSGNGNVILNFGGGAATNPATGVFASNQWNFNVSNNVINNNNGIGINHPGILRGIFLNSSSINANVTCSSNTLTIKGAGTSQNTFALDIETGINGSGNKVSIINNTIEQCKNASATTGNLYCIYASSSVDTFIIENNIIKHDTLTASTGVLYGIAISSTVKKVFVKNNQISFLNKQSGGKIFGIEMISISDVESVMGNTIHDLTIAGGSGATEVTGILQSTIDGTKTFKGNVIYNLSSLSTNSSSTIYGLSVKYGTVINVSDNEIYQLSGNARTVRGMEMSINTAGGGTASYFKNKIYDLSTSNTLNNSSVYGLSVTQGTVATFHVYNNLIGNLTSPASAASDAIRGISISGNTINSSVNLSYNTVLLNATSTGVNFGTSALFHNSNATSTTFNLSMKNNILINNSTANGSGLTVAFRRSLATLANYSTLSNNNLLYAGIPSASNLIYYDNTNADQLLTDFKTRMNPRESNSITENTSFTSTTGSSPDFLHVLPASNSLCDGAAITIPTITDDFDGNTRNNTSPDIGGDEFISVSCDTHVTSSLNSGPGSLRNALTCANGGLITFDASLSQIELTESLNINNKNFELKDLVGSAIQIKINSDVASISTSTAANLYFENIHFIDQSVLKNNALWINSGRLTFNASTISGETGSTNVPIVQNTGSGTIDVEGEVDIQKE